MQNMGCLSPELDNFSPNKLALGKLSAASSFSTSFAFLSQLPGSDFGASDYTSPRTTFGVLYSTGNLDQARRLLMTGAQSQLSQELVIILTTWL